jgi:hypothetical protein
VSRFAVDRGGNRPGLRVDFGPDAPDARLVMTVPDLDATAAQMCGGGYRHLTHSDTMYSVAVDEG